MKKKQVRRLALNPETLRHLGDSVLGRAVGASNPTVCNPDSACLRCTQLGSDCHTC
jgi:hypothetical protein